VLVLFRLSILHDQMSLLFRHQNYFLLQKTFDHQ
jgi:hypothetical protein